MSAALQLTVGDTVYTVAFSDFTALDAQAFRAQVGVRLFDAFTGERDLDTMAGVIWLHRRKTEPRLTYADVAAALTYDNLEATDVEDGGDPEA